jgi:hypothetical protein
MSPYKVLIVRQIKIAAVEIGLSATINAYAAGEIGSAFPQALGSGWLGDPLERRRKLSQIRFGHVKMRRKADR